MSEIRRTSWVIVTITGDPELAKDIKDVLGLFLDWLILEPDQFMKARPFLKDYDQTTALTSQNRLLFGVAKKLERVMEEKAGFRLAKEKSEDKKEL